MVKACIGANGFTQLRLLYHRTCTLILLKSLNLDPLHATVQLGGFNLVKFKLARFHCSFIVACYLYFFTNILCMHTSMEFREKVFVLSERDHRFKESIRTWAKYF